MLDDQVDRPPHKNEINWRDKDDAKKELEEEIQNFLQKAIDWHPEQTESAPPVLGMKVSAGAGKTMTTLQSIAEQGAELLKRGHIFFYAPTLDLAEQAANDFAKLNSGLPHMVLRGRSAIDPQTKKAMCARADVAADLVDKVSSITQALCRKEISETETIYAPCADGCAYLAQEKKETHHVVFLAHAYLTLKVPLDGPVALRIIDEKFWQVLTKTASLTRDRWLSPQYASPSKDTLSEDKNEMRELSRRVRHCVSQALEFGDPVHVKLRELNVDEKCLDALAEHEAQQVRQIAIRPDMNDAQLAHVRKALSGKAVEHARKSQRIFKLLADTASQDTTERLSLSLFPKGNPDGVDVSAHWLEEFPQESPFLLLDADLNETITKRFFPKAEIRSLHVKPTAEILQVRNLTLSKNWLNEPGNAAERQRQVVGIIKGEAARANAKKDGKALVVGTRENLRILLKAAGKEDVTLSKTDPTIPAKLFGADVRWFGPKMLGVNTYKEYATVILIGRLQVPVSDLENYLRAMFGDSGEALDLVKNNKLVFEQKDGGPETEAGKKHLSRNRQVHTDDRGTALLEQTREAASEQAIARLRLVHAESPKRVVILSNVPLPNLPVDRYVNFKDLVREHMGVRENPRYQDLKSAVVSEDGRPRFRGLRTGKQGLHEDTKGFLKATKDVTVKLPKGGVVEALKLIASDKGWSATEVVLAPKRGGKPFSAVVFVERNEALEVASGLWPKFTPKHIQALQDETDVLEAVSERT